MKRLKMRIAVLAFAALFVSPLPAHSSASGEVGAAVAWGVNTSGQLGDNTTDCRQSPTTVREIEPIVAVAAGGRHSLAIGQSGALYAWGANDRGQLGTGSANHTAKLPREIPGLTGVWQVEAGNDFSLALTSDLDRVYAWGDNKHGQLGAGSTGGFSRVPVEVMISLSPDEYIYELAAGGRHAFVRTSHGRLWAWGDNRKGQLGTNEVGESSPRPVRVNESLPLLPVLIDAGDSHSAVLSHSGQVFAWGGNDSGQLGDGTTISRSTPALVAGLRGLTYLSVGRLHNVATGGDRSVWTWGDNSHGQLGDGTRNNRAIAASVPLPRRDGEGIFGEGADSAMAGGDITVAFGSASRVWAWGKNSCGQLGIGTMGPDETSPISKSDFPVRRIDIGSDHSLGIK